MCNSQVTVFAGKPYVFQSVRANIVTPIFNIILLKKMVVASLDRIPKNFASPASLREKEEPRRRGTRAQFRVPFQCPSPHQSLAFSRATRHAKGTSKSPPGHSMHAAFSRFLYSWFPYRISGILSVTACSVSSATSCSLSRCCSASQRLGGSKKTCTSHAQIPSRKHWFFRCLGPNICASIFS